MAQEAIVINNTEVMQVADAVSREKGIDKESILDAMEKAIEVAARRKYGHEMRIAAEIDRHSGGIAVFREREVVEEVEDHQTEMALQDAKERDNSLEVGDVVRDPLPPIDLGRIAAQTAKQVIIQKVRDAEREVQYEEFKDRVGEIVNGVVKRVERGTVTVELGQNEAVIPRMETIPRENIRQGERIRAYVKEVSRKISGPQVILSRTAPEFVAKLFAQEVPEVYDGIIEIKAVSRDPSSRAKVCVYSNDPSIDPVGSCVGVRGSRVQAIINELQGERIDIIEWAADPATLVVNCLSPAEVSKVVIDEERGHIEVVVPEEQQSIAIGRRGQNVRLASDIVGWEIDILTEDEEAKRRADEFAKISGLFVEALDVEDVIGELLVAEGFGSVEQVAFVPVEELTQIEGFDEDIAVELQSRAKAWVEERTAKLEARRSELGLSDEIAELPYMNIEIMVQLGEQGVKTLDDLADLSRDEFFEMAGEDTGLKNAQVDEMIMAARAHWFDDEPEGDATDQDVADASETKANA